MAKSNIIFLTVKTNQQKIETLCQTIQRHFDQKDKVLICVQNDQALQYVDDLLWKSPAEGFLPHQISDVESHEMVVITKNKSNLNQAKVLFNLCTDPTPLVDAFETIYELDDHTHPEKQAQSEQRCLHYSQQNLSLIKKN